MIGRVPDASGRVAQVMTGCEKVLTLDLRGNPLISDAGISALVHALKTEKPGHPRSVVGVSSSNTRLDVLRKYSDEQASDLRLTVAEMENHLYSESVTAGMGGKGGQGVISLNRRGGGGGKEDGKGSWSPLIWAARIDHRQIAETLLANGAHAWPPRPRGCANLCPVAAQLM